MSGCGNNPLEVPPGLLVSWLARLRNERVDLYGKNGQRKGYATVDRDSGCVDLIETGGATASALELLEESPRSPCGVG